MVNQLRLVVALFAGITVALYDLPGLWVGPAYLAAYASVGMLFILMRCGNRPTNYFKSSTAIFEKAPAGLMPFVVTWLIAHNVAFLF